MTKEAYEVFTLDSEKVLEATQDLSYKAISRAYPLEKIFPETLAAFVRLTQSELGFIGKVFYREKKEVFKIYSFELNEAWKNKNKQFYELFKQRGSEICSPNSIISELINHREPLIINDFKDYKACAEYPEEHPDIDSFLGIPVVYKNLTIGIIGLANSGLEYSEKMLTTLAPLIASTVSTIRGLEDLDMKNNVDAILRRFKYALDESSIVARTDVKGFITYVNDRFCETSKFTKSELVGQNHRIVNSGLHSADFFKEMWTTIASGNIWKGIMRNKAKNGAYYWVDTTIIPFLNGDGKPYEYLAIRHDITELKQIEEELKHKNKELDEFAYIASHDLKAPLRGIASMIGFIKEDLKDISIETVHQFEIIDERIKRLYNIVNGLLEYSRIGTLKDSSKQVINSRSFINEIIASFQYSGKVIITVDENLPEIYSSEILVHQIFSNIISNAVKYCDKYIAEVSISYVDKNYWHRFYIRDNGPGIPDEAKEKVFKMFHTLQSKDSSSTGIGLAIVQKAVTGLNGRVKITDNLPFGTCFEISLPKT